jgi:thioredoxin reductase (NADPH)
MARDRVLVVDDEPDIRDAMRVLLDEVMGLEVVLAPDAASGLEALAKHGDTIRLIISDYRMPRMDGLQFLALAAGQQPAIPRVLLTAYADTQLAVDALNKAGVSHFMTKPVDPAQMEGVVTRLLQESQSARQRRAAFGRTLDTLRGDGNHGT